MTERTKERQSKMSKMKYRRMHVECHCELLELAELNLLNVRKSFCLTYKYAKCHQPNGVLCIQMTLLLTKRGHLTYIYLYLGRNTQGVLCYG